VIERLDSPKEKGRLLTEPDMRLRGSANAWAIGDCASIINAHDGQLSPPTGQFAERQGRQCAENIMRTMRGEPTRPFSFRMLGQLCSIGGHCAVAEMFGFRLSGFWAWFAWRGVYLFKLPDWSRRIQVGMDWAWLLFFPRDLAYLKTDVTDRVTHSHFEPGDIVFRQNDSPACFYVIEQGEIEIIRSTPEKPEGEVIAVLGPGNFFGEQALLNNRPRSASARARTGAEVVVMGRNIFTTISKSLSPLQAALTSAVTRRSSGFWQERPQVLAALRSFALSDFIDPAPQPVLKPTDTLSEVTRLFAANPSDFFYVSAEGGRLDGMITITDLLRAQGGGLPGTTPLGQFMAREPAVIAATEDCAAAAAAFREFGYKSLPVVADRQSRRIVGTMRARKLMARVLTQTGSSTPATPA
jgi:NADH dehydrogenase